MTQKILESEFDPEKHVKEYKRKCNQCSKVWHSLASREEELKKQIKSSGCSESLSACTCSQPGIIAANQSKHTRQTTEEILHKLHLCPECSSQNYSEEVLIYEQKK